MSTVDKLKAMIPLLEVGYLATVMAAKRDGVQCYCLVGAAAVASGIRQPDEQGFIVTAPNWDDLAPDVLAELAYTIRQEYPELTAPYPGLKDSDHVWRLNDGAEHAVSGIESRHSELQERRLKLVRDTIARLESEA